VSEKRGEIEREKIVREGHSETEIETQTYMEE